MTNNKETFELNRKRIEKDLNRRNTELENIKIDQEKKSEVSSLEKSKEVKIESKLN